MGKILSLIINGRSNVNVSSLRLVEKLEIPTLAHPKPYKLQWLSEKGEMVVDRKVYMNLGRKKERGEDTKYEEVEAFQGPITRRRLKKLKEEVKRKMDILRGQGASKEGLMCLKNASVIGIKEERLADSSDDMDSDNDVKTLS
ncbi:hypothetical protein CR513_02664, partial [Mucuna pruriens]